MGKYLAGVKTGDITGRFGRFPVCRRIFVRTEAVQAELLRENSSSAIIDRQFSRSDRKGGRENAKAFSRSDRKGGRENAKAFSRSDRREDEKIVGLLP
jgi:hypothetical protein